MNFDSKLRSLLLFWLLTGSHAIAAETEQDQFDLQAHRGGLGLVTESTLQAFANALELGVSTLELDIQITEDRQAVVTHDRQVQSHKCRDTEPATTNDPDFPYVGKYIKDLTLRQIRTLDCGFQQLPGYPEQKVIPGASMPLLSEVLQLVKDYKANTVMLNIETKVEAGAPHETAPREQFIEIVIGEIEAADMANQVTIQSFDWGTLSALNQRAPHIPTVALTNGQSFLQCGEPGRSPWLGGIDMDDFNCDVVAAVATLGVAALSPVHGTPQDGRITDEHYEPFVTGDMVKKAHALGMKVIPWTVDDRETMEYLLDLNVDGMITNYPNLLRKIMAERDLPIPPKFELAN